MIIVNTPHNPVGKVFTRHELERIAALAEEFNLLVMADEVVRLSTSNMQASHPADNLSYSTTAWYLMAKNTSASPPFPECGIAQ